MNQHCTMEVIARMCCSLWGMRGGCQDGAVVGTASAQRGRTDAAVRRVRRVAARRGASSALHPLLPRPRCSNPAPAPITASPSARDPPLAAPLAERVDAQRHYDLDREEAERAQPVAHSGRLAPPWGDSRRGRSPDHGRTACVLPLVPWYRAACRTELAAGVCGAATPPAGLYCSVTARPSGHSTPWGSWPGTCARACHAAPALPCRRAHACGAAIATTRRWAC